MLLHDSPYQILNLIQVRPDAPRSEEIEDLFEIVDFIAHTVWCGLWLLHSLSANYLLEFLFGGHIRSPLDLRLLRSTSNAPPFQVILGL